MKKFAYIFTTLCLMFTTGCSEETTEPVAPQGPQAPYTLSVDRAEVTVGESVTFTVMSADGIDISDKCTYCSNTACYPTRTVKMQEEGTFVFESHYLNGDPAYPEGVLVDNSVEVVVKRAVEYTVSASKTTVRTGKGVTLAMHDSNGDEVTRQSVFFVDGEQLEVARFVTDAEPRNYTVTALYMGDESRPEGIEASNDLIIKAIDDPEIYSLVPSATTLFVGEVVSFEVWSNYDERLTSSFAITDSEGNDVASPYYRKFTAAGDYTFTATRGEDTTDPVTITVKERGELDKSRFYRRSLMGDLTATWCMQCPSMVRMINYLEKNLIDDRLVIVGFHAGDYTIASDLGNTGPIFAELLWAFESIIWNQIPAYTIDFNYNYTSNSWSTHEDDYSTGAPLIARNISGSQSEEYAVPGIAATSTLNGRTLTLNVRVTAAEADDYYIGIALTEDRVIAPQSGAANNFEHRHVGQGMITDATKVAVPIGQLTAGEEKSMDYTYEIPATLHGYDVNLDNCEVAVWVCRKESNAAVAPLGYLCANALSLHVGESVDYQYEYKR